MKLTEDMVLKALDGHRGATYYIAYTIKDMFPEWDRKTARVLYVLKKLEKKGKVERFKTSYKRQISWRIRGVKR